MKTDERTLLTHVEQDLLRHFPDVPRATVRKEIRVRARAFEGAKVRTYVPVLVQKQVRDRLRGISAPHGPVDGC